MSLLDKLVGEVLPDLVEVEDEEQAVDTKATEIIHIADVNTRVLSFFGFSRFFIIPL